MTNINCSSNCIYQKDGKCTYGKITASLLSSDSICAYFVKHVPEEIQKAQI